MRQGTKNNTGGGRHWSATTAQLVSLRNVRPNLRRRSVAGVYGVSLTRVAPPCSCGLIEESTPWSKRNSKRGMSASIFLPMPMPWMTSTHQLSAARYWPAQEHLLLWKSAWTMSWMHRNHSAAAHRLSGLLKHNKSEVRRSNDGHHTPI